MIINNRKDLDAAPADTRERFIAGLAASINKWNWENGDWVIRQNTTDIECFEFTLDDFPDAPTPEKPNYNPDQRERDKLPDRIAARRYEAETAGITVGGISFNTDRQSQSLITGAALSATRNPDYTVRWKTQDGPVTLDADQLGAAADAVRDHVQACFDREFELLDALEAGTFDESMLDEGWPE